MRWPYVNTWLRTPLNVILGRVEALREGVAGDVTDAQADALVDIDDQGRHRIRRTVADRLRG